MGRKINNKIYTVFEHRKTLWTAFIVLLGGIAGLILSIGELIFSFQLITKFALLLIGLILLYFVFDGISDANKAISYCLKQEE